MASTTAAQARPAFAIKLLVAGLVAGIVMAMWQMMVEAFGGNGFWSPSVYIAATLLRNLQSVAMPVPFDFVSVMVGLMGHMMNSVIFGLIFTFLIGARFHSLVGQVVAGLIYGVVIFLVMQLIFVPILDPVMLRLNTIAFLIAHMMFGVVLGALNYLLTRSK